MPTGLAGSASRSGFRPVPDLGAVLDAAPDAVYVCVPPFAHGPIEETVAAAGAALFVEKPLGLDEAVTERVAGPAGDGPDRLGRRGGTEDPVAARAG